MVKTKGIQLYDVLGPGWYNIGIGAVLVLGGIAYFVVRHGEMGARKDSTAGGGPLKVVMLVSVMAIYLFLIDLVSYLLASLVFFFLVTRVSGFVSWRTNIALALAFGICFLPRICGLDGNDLSSWHVLVTERGVRIDRWIYYRALPMSSL